MKLGAIATAGVLLGCLGLVPTPSEAQAADPGDVGSIDAMIASVYDVISGEPGEPRDWERWHSLFAEGATLGVVRITPAGEFRRGRMTPESYVEQSGDMLERDGFFEAEIGRVTERYGMIAHAFSTYESYRSAANEKPFARGINSFQLMHDGTRSWIVSIFWQGESAAFPIPDGYIGEIDD